MIYLGETFLNNEHISQVSILGFFMTKNNDRDVSIFDKKHFENKTIKDLKPTPSKQSYLFRSVYESLLLYISLCLLFVIFFTIILLLMLHILLLFSDYMVFLNYF